MAQLWALSLVHDYFSTFLSHQWRFFLNDINAFSALCEPCCNGGPVSCLNHTETFTDLCSRSQHEGLSTAWLRFVRDRVSCSSSRSLMLCCQRWLSEPLIPPYPHLLFYQYFFLPFFHWGSTFLLQITLDSALVLWGKLNTEKTERRKRIKEMSYKTLGIHRELVFIYDPEDKKENTS